MRLSSWRTPVVADPFEQRVTSICRSRRIERAKGSLLAFIWVLFIFNLLFVVRVLADFPTVPLRLLIPFHILTASCLVLNSIPQLITDRSVDAHYWLAVFLVSVVTYMEHGEVYAFRVWTLVCCCCLFNLKAWANTVAFVLVASVKTIADPALAIDAWCVCAAASLVVWGVDNMLTAKVRLELQAADSGQELTAVKTLLGSICDVVVELDQKLRLTQHSGKLSDVLLHGQGRSLQGASLQEFMPTEEERGAFRERLITLEKTPSKAEVFHTTLRDSNANNIAMEFFSVAFVGSDTRSRHLLGMREFTDTQALTPSPEFRPPPPQQARPPRERACRKNWPGTPASVGRNEIQKREGEESSQASSCQASQASELGGLAGPRRPTDNCAKKLSLMATLATWQVPLPEGACCQLHAMLADMQRVVDSMTPWKCNVFSSTDAWQCKRCGIMDEQYRVPGSRSRARGCQLCRRVAIARVPSERGDRTGAVASL